MRSASCAPAESSGLLLPEMRVRPAPSISGPVPAMSGSQPSDRSKIPAPAGKDLSALIPLESTLLKFRKSVSKQRTLSHLKSTLTRLCAVSALDSALPKIRGGWGGLVRDAPVGSLLQIHLSHLKIPLPTLLLLPLHASPTTASTSVPKAVAVACYAPPITLPCASITLAWKRCASASYRKSPLPDTAAGFVDAVAQEMSGANGDRTKQQNASAEPANRQSK